MTRTPLVLATLAALACIGAPAPAAAETVNCVAITSLPATLSTQGVYCLTQDLATSLASGNAITVAVNNVTIDCNGYKLGGLGAGPTTAAYGIRAADRNNVVVRNCNLRGFSYGIYLDGEGHVVEGNRLDGNTRGGIVVFGNGGLISDNRVLDTGGAVGPVLPSIGIYTLADVDVVGNTVDNVYDPDGGGAMGIYTFGSHGGAIDRNRVRIVELGGGATWGIRNVSPTRVSVRDNQIVGVPGNGVAVDCENVDSAASGNLVFGFDDKLLFCRDGGGNFLK